MKTIGLIASVLVVTVAIVAVRSRTPQHAQERERGALVVPVNAETVTLSVPKMDCAGCEISVRIAANRVDGVEGVKTDSARHTATVVFDPAKTTAQTIVKAITKGTGFDTDVLPFNRRKAS